MLFLLVGLNGNSVVHGFYGVNEVEDSVTLFPCLLLLLFSYFFLGFFRGGGGVLVIYLLLLFSFSVTLLLKRGLLTDGKSKLLF